MLEFHNTQLGKKFYEKDLPALIQSINKLTEQLSVLNENEQLKFKLNKKKLIKDSNVSE